ncbi:hypothetical protein TWF730_006727 [Orbilia blumenaviensis]|uniref:Uncharacterized protein n=1 Tax=Orbilia blumenaviensis TaxID=1796055 RepID=A0AAV9VHF3_9PEZI
MKLTTTLILISISSLLHLSTAKESNPDFPKLKRYEEEHGFDHDELLQTKGGISATVIFDDVDTSHTITNDRGPKTSQESISLIEPADSGSEPTTSTSTSSKPTDSDNDDDDDDPPPLSDSHSSSDPNPSSPPSKTSKKQSKKPNSSASTPPEEPTVQTTTAYYKKLVKVHINPAPAKNYPSKPKNYPTFADYEQGIVYIKGIPHQVLAADTDYSQLKQSEDGTSWEPMFEKDDKAKQEEFERELEHQDKLIAGEGGGGGSGHALYSADVANGSENAVKKAVFFGIIAAGIITIGLLVYYGIIAG